MSLRPDRQTEQVDIEYITPWTQERGGCLTWANASGIDFVQYSHDASGVLPVGIQINDVEWVNFSRQPWKQRFRETALPCDIVGIGTQGDYVTDWLYLIGDIQSGDPMYVGPSGTFTNFAGLGNHVIGRFLGPLDPDVHEVTMRGMGFSRQYIDTCTKQLVWENNPDDRVIVTSPGYAKIRVDIGTRIR
jgi:hypothetical protein